MVFTPPTKFNQNMINNKAYKKLYSDYEKIINNRSALYKLVEEYSETIKKNHCPSPNLLRSKNIDKKNQTILSKSQR